LLLNFASLRLGVKQGFRWGKKKGLVAEARIVDVVRPGSGRRRTTSFSSEPLSFSRQLSWLRSSSIDSPIRICDLKKSQRDSYIESLHSNVKKKMHLSTHSLDVFTRVFRSAMR
jgi:hypothetical protein